MKNWRWSWRGESRRGERAASLIYLCLALLTLCVLGCQAGHQQLTGNRYVQASDPSALIKSCNPSHPSESWAVVVGVNFYQDERIPDLEGAVDDAWNFYHYLVSEKGARFEPLRVRLLLNEQATKAGIEDALGQFLSGACPQDKIVVYFAGHGAPEPNKPEEAFLLVHDTTLDSMVSSALSMSQLPNFLQWRTGGTGQLLMLIDACHSGYLQFPDSRGFRVSAPKSNEEQQSVESARAESVNNTLSTVVRGQKGWGAISAAAPDQLAGESGGRCSLAGKDYHGGIFTCALLEALGGVADLNRDQQLSFDELFTRLKTTVKSIRGEEQVPQRSGDMVGTSSLFPPLNGALELPAVPARYQLEIHPKPYRKWLYGSLAVTGLSLLSAIAMNFVANESAREVNNYSDTVATQAAGEAGYRSLEEAHQADKTLAQQLYLGTAILSAISGGLAILDLLDKPEGEVDVYAREPALILEVSQ